MPKSKRRVRVEILQADLTLMRAKRGFLLYLLGVPFLLVCVLAHADERWQACFTPGENCTAAIVTELGKANASIEVQAYSFTSAPIAKALVEAKERGLSVRVILDKSQQSERYSSASFLAHVGIPVWIDSKVAIAHNKVMVIDGKTVITGSFNFTKAAQERNAENVLIVEDPRLAERYHANWEARRVASMPYPAKP